MPADPVAAVRWHDAAALARFPIYEAAGSGVRWAGGFAHSGRHVEVITLVDGDEVTVDSSLPEHSPDSSRWRAQAADLVWRHVAGQRGDLPLPHSITIEPDVRTVTVDGVEHTAQGMRIAGTADWFGTIHMEGVTITIRTASPARLELRACENASSLPEFPPETQ